MSFANFLVNLLSGAGQAQAAPAAAQAAPQQPFPVPTPRPVMLPQRAPVPTPRPSQGPLTPSRPQQPVIPIAPPQPSMPAAAPQQQNPLMTLLSGGSGGGDWRRMARAAMSGIASADPRSEGMLAFAQGASGAAKHYTDADAALREQALEKDKIAYERSKDAADLELKRAADMRASRSAELADQKTAAEIARMARQNGLTVSQMLEIERIAQAAGQAEYDPKKRREIVASERQRLLEQFAGGDRPGGLSAKEGAGLSPDAITATGPNGEKLILRDGQWEPLD
jgi:hypothetical protein